MPHITIEYSDNLHNLDESWVLLQVNKALMGLGIFMDADIQFQSGDVGQGRCISGKGA